MEIKDYVAPLIRWWWLLVLGTVAAVVPAYLLMRQQVPVYRARTTVMIGQAISSTNPGWDQLELGQRLANTYSDLVQRAPIRNAVMASLGLEYAPSYSAALVQDTQLLEITATDTDPHLAQAVANEVAHQLALLTPTGGGSDVRQRQAFVKEELDDLQARIKETRAEIDKTQTELGSLLSAREIAEAQNQVGALQSKLDTLQSNYAALLSNTDEGALNAITVVEPAELPTSPIASGGRRMLLVTAAAGFLLAAAAAYLLSYLDDTFKNPDDVQRGLGLTTLGVVPRAELAGGSELIMVSERHSAATEAYRGLRTNLQFASVDRPLRSLLVTSAGPSEGKSLTTANLAVALAAAGQRVIAVDADLHRPRLHRLFGLSNNQGLTTALLDEHPGDEGLLKATSIPGLRVLTSGPLPPNPTELLGSQRMRELVTSLGGHADIVVLDSPPVVILSDAPVLSTQVDGVLLVLEAGGTRREMGRRAVESLRTVKAHVVGAVLNRVPTRGSGYYYYYHYSGYYKQYGYSDDGKDAKGASQRGASRLEKMRPGKRHAAVDAPAEDRPSHA